MHSDAGALLVEDEVITEEQLQQALGAAVRYGGTLAQNLIRLSLLTDEELASFMSEKLQLPMAEANQFENLPAFITRLVPSDIVLAHRIVPIMLHQGVIAVAIADPTDRAAMEEIAFATGYQASPVVAACNLIEAAMARYYGIPPEESRIPTEPNIEQFAAPEPVERQVQASESASVEPAEEPAVKVPASELGVFDQGPPVQAGSEPAPIETQPTVDVRPQRLEVVETDSSELEELFFGLSKDEDEVIHLTRKKGSEQSSAPGSITDAIRSQAETKLEKDGAGFEPEDLARQPVEPVGILSTTPDVGPTQPDEIASVEVTDRPTGQEPASAAIGISSDSYLEPLNNPAEARNLIANATDRDEVARTLTRFSLAFMPRAAMFIVKKDILVGWMGGGEGVSINQVKGIMIPLGSPSAFRTVRETETDYFGSMPRTTVNDIFLSALGDARPKRVLLVPITVRHKPICILYGDCGFEHGFSKDLSPIHLLIPDVSQAFERIILERKMSRRVIR
ncbi:MAG: hypothetical protein JRJ87_14335 [Deltaproteobacteria bacterium]|nr:hypothetical protein [Deltaproteobacteria bacterium]